MAESLLAPPGRWSSPQVQMTPSPGNRIRSSEYDKPVVLRIWTAGSLPPWVQQKSHEGNGESIFVPMVWATPAPHPRNTLEVYFVDVEGSQATLFVTPAGQSLLIDTGWPGNDGRDANRILAAAHNAGIRGIDFVLITHFHRDHAGGITQLAAKIPVGTGIDHGENREHSDPATEQVYRDHL